MFKSFKIYKGQIIDLEAFLEGLSSFGYNRQAQVCDEGDFSCRGSIVDIYPITFDAPVRIELEKDVISSIKSFNIENGKPLWEHAIVIVLPYRKTKSKPQLKMGEENPLRSFIELQKGDCVVHVNHGIGIYRGIKKIKGKDKAKSSDHLLIEYAGGDKLYVPVEEIHLVQKYLGLEHKRPKLYKLDSKEWKRIKEKVNKGVRNYALDLLRIQALREALKGHVYSADSDWSREFEKTFPYQETKDQIRATQEVKADMESNKPMDRLICGDVGYGKTEVAMRAAFKVVVDNKQVAILVPTTILAEQHYLNFSMRLKDFPVKVAMLSRFRTKQEQAQIVKELALGQVDVVIGTHRLLSGDIKFKDLGLVIIDEEQRFGVKSKERLKHLRLLVDVLTLTATPIPRTLYMSLMGARDMSIVNTPPQDRLPIETHVSEFDEHLVKQAILKELRRKGQIYFVHNRIEDIEEIFSKIKKMVPRLKVALGHGRMSNRELEKVMVGFLKGEIDCLISTTIIASGIDIPNANTLIVNDAQNFGLADLHQLRGRVGRFKNKAYTYFLIPKNIVLTEDQKRRLEAIREHTELGSGFRIAFEDLQIRGAGNLLGEQQHGFIMAVGFDLYCRMLRDAVNGLKKIISKGA